MIEKNKAVVRRFYDAVLNQGRAEVAEEIVAPDFSVHGGMPGTPAAGPSVLTTISQRLRAGFADTTFDIDDLIAEGDRVAVRWTMRGKHTGEYFGIAPTGAAIELHAIVVFRVVDGRLAELWPLVDHADLRRQIDAAAGAA
jgi:steroid delta-isomerase-like uncharacterized protein